MTVTKQKKIREPLGDKVFNVMNYIFLGFFFLVVAYPLIYVVSASFSDSNAVISGEVWLWPVGFNIEAYKTIFQEKSIMTGYMNTIIYTVFGTIFNLILTTLAAYPLSRKKLFGKRIITWFFMLTMFFSGGLIPLYILVKDLTLLNLPIIGIIKRDYPGSSVRITPTIKEIDELMEVQPEVIAVDATCRPRPDGKTLDEFYELIRKKYPTQKLMADCATLEEMIHADQLGFDFIGTTLVGYTEESRGQQIKTNDFELIRTLVKHCKHPVIGEGNINTPEKVKRVMELGAYSVVVGSAITRPQLITETFVKALEEI